MDSNLPPSNTSFNEDLVTRAEMHKDEITYAIIKNAMEGDASSMKMLLNAFEEGKFQQEEKIKLEPEQFKQIIKLMAERLI